MLNRLTYSIFLPLFKVAVFEILFNFFNAHLKHSKLTAVGIRYQKMFQVDELK